MIPTVNPLAVEDLQASDCVDTLLPPIDGDERSWRKRVRSTYKMFLVHRYLPGQALLINLLARMVAIEARASELERVMAEERKQMFQKVESIDHRLISIESGIGLIKWFIAIGGVGALAALVAYLSGWHP